ncbi:uncharacterized protein I303_107943 [Kwoniella dejecticola CBS 10117]|uniref:Uncharacterized protein n=1 Tax=Kwoniella dejecticola CBS 10117 TaxID=1296121 RepID=A0A1A5ZW41_9TREE|nr:uncharacterized protein I303_07936 [Kwoniella dejecticola CBS 10117]OBR82022.1 hypothetical protein I303_07936 [Kwoniella dejecticola CBS 10117]
MTSPFDLSNLGAELDASRRRRRSCGAGIPIDSRASYEIDVSEGMPDLSTSVDSYVSSSSINTASEAHDLDLDLGVDVDIQTQRQGSAKGEQVRDCVERPYPLCLLCLNRPPSAVLLPCCHLNLCYICAPLLIHRYSKAKPKPTTTTSLPISSQTCERTPYHLALLKATKNHPKSRALALGGYRPPEENRSGGEYTGRGLLSASSQGKGTEIGVGMGTGTGMGLVDEADEDGRIRIRPSSATNQEEIVGDDLAKCLVCREGIKGWLRVYTG